MLLIVTSSNSTRAAVSYDFVSGDLRYKINEDGKSVTLVRYDGHQPSGELIIPASVPYNSKEYSVTSIGDYAFISCTSLTSVTIPESVTAIGIRAFVNCYSLTSLTIPEGVTSIGEDAFYEVRHIINKSKCTDGRPWGARVENGTVDGDFVYEDDTKAKLLVYVGKGGEVTIPESVTAIGDEAFLNCKSLTSVTIPEGVTSIGESAFSICTSLTSVTIPESVTSIGMMAFYEVKHIINKSHCKDPRHWGARVENGTVDGDFVYENDTKATLLVYVGKGGEVTIPKSVTSIGDGAFWGCTSLTSIAISEDVKSIGKNAFRECTSLTSVTIPDGVTFIGDDAFWFCTSVENVYLYANPDNLTWSENGCDDFKENAETQCHVLSNYYDEYKAKFTGKVNVTFENDVIELSSEDITISGISNVIYTGKELEPIVVSYGDKTLKAGTDYTITYTNNINAGTAKATITGITKFCIGSRDIEFTIEKATPTYTPPTIAEQKCTAKLADITLPKGFAFAANSKELTIGENKRILVFTPEDVINYKEINNIEVTITVNNHPYGTPTYTWSDDGKTCTATVVCQNDESHIVTETATITSEITTPATSEAKGTTTYTATFKNEMFKTQTKTVEDIDKLPKLEPEPQPENPSTPVSSIDNSGNNVKVWSFARTIYIASTPDSQYKIIDLQGRTIKSATTTSSLEQINISNSGIYVVIINGKSYKVSL